MDADARVRRVTGMLGLVAGRALCCGGCAVGVGLLAWRIHFSSGKHWITKMKLRGPDSRYALTEFAVRFFGIQMDTL